MSSFESLFQAPQTNGRQELSVVEAWKSLFSNFPVSQESDSDMIILVSDVEPRLKKHLNPFLTCHDPIHTFRNQTIFFMIITPSISPAIETKVYTSHLLHEAFQ